MCNNLGGELRQLIIVILEKKITGPLPTFYILHLLPWAHQTVAMAVVGLYWPL